MLHAEKHAHVKEIRDLAEKMKSKVTGLVGGDNALVGKIDDVVTGCEGHVNSTATGAEPAIVGAEPATVEPAAHAAHAKK